MIIGEDRSKVQNIVKPNVPYFQKLYSNILQDCPQVVYKHHLGRLEASGFLKNIKKKRKQTRGEMLYHIDRRQELCHTKAGSCSHYTCYYVSIVELILQSGNL